MRENGQGKFNFKKFLKNLFTGNILYKAAAGFLGVLLWLFLGYINAGG
jgi:hypothetical protein